MNDEHARGAFNHKDNNEPSPFSLFFSLSLSPIINPPILFGLFEHNNTKKYFSKHQNYAFKDLKNLKRKLNYRVVRRGGIEKKKREKIKRKNREKENVIPMMMKAVCVVC